MQSLKAQVALSPEERSQKRKVIVRDSVSLLTLLVVTIALFTATVFLFRAFSDLRSRLAKRWLNRGEAALHGGHPELAIEDLRSALAYSPGQRGIEVELAEALAGAGRTQEAVSYFNTLWEAEPGNGNINLQLARLAAKEKLENEALEYYHASIYGTWEGDGTTKRREVRLELIDYLIATGRLNQARAELLIAAGNAPDDPTVKLTIAALMEKADDPASASRIYKAILQHGPPSLAALEGAGRTAFAMGNFVQARDYLHRALAHSDSKSHSAQSRQDIADLAEEAVQILLLYPSPSLSSLAQGERILRDRRLAQSRIQDCASAGSQYAANPEVAALLDRWQEEPPKLKVSDLERDPERQQAEMQLVYDTERIADKYCGPAEGENALLSKIAANPSAVEAQ
jgi:tetratricopeptide (TPR) repeat protein